MTTYEQHQAMLVPLSFVLKQINGLDAPLTLKVISGWQNKLLELSLINTHPELIISEHIRVTPDTMRHLQAGFNGDKVTSKGVAMLRTFIKMNLLPLTGAVHFPEALQEYIKLDLDDEVQEQTHLNLFDELSVSSFTYSNLYYLFSALKGSELGEATLQIDGRTVTRLVQETASNESGQRFETLFMWENDACRTQTLKRSA